MPEYRNVRLELRVYEELKRRMLPMESMSQCIERLLLEMDEVYGYAQAIVSTKFISHAYKQEWQTDLLQATEDIEAGETKD